MDRISIMKNTVQDYAWGSYTAIPEILGQKAVDKPQAELWMGAHPKAPSKVQCNGEWMSLLKLIETNPEDILGERASKAFNNSLPFLFKVLAAAKPLSIQAHPSRDQAKEGFERENRIGIPFDAPHRNYRDPNHKPECICALTPFWALNGFRKISEMVSLFRKVNPKGLEEGVEALLKQPDSRGLKEFFRTLMTMDKERQKQIVDDAVKKAHLVSNDDFCFQWILKLHQEYPSDIGVLSPLFLNLVCLSPGQAMFLPAGELHAYLDGVGIELMSNSDNVLRGGLTPKHVDVKELMAVLTFGERSVEVIETEEQSETERVYPTRAEEFVLSVIALRRGLSHISGENRSVEILLCTDGKATINEYGKNDAITIVRGNSVVVPASIPKYNIEGDAVFYKAAVPI